MLNSVLMTLITKIFLIFDGENGIISMALDKSDIRINILIFPQFNKNMYHNYYYSPSLCKHALTNKLKIVSPKNKNFQKKNSVIFHISAQNIG